MGIDYIVHYECEPKRALTVEGLMGRLKGRERANAIIQLYRDQGDERPPGKMGFEMVRRNADGTDETEVIVVQDLLDLAADLEPWEAHCADCPANLFGTPFSCTGSINYPISAQAERWLLDQLPSNDTPLLFMLLQRMIIERGYTGQAAAPLRAQQGVFMENEQTPTRDLEAVQVTGDQVFEMLFLTGPIRPAYGTLLLQLFGGLSADLDADDMMKLAVPPSEDWIDAHTPFLHRIHAEDDASIKALKGFFYALHVGYRLSVPVLLDV